MKNIVWSFNDSQKADSFIQEMETLERQDEFRRCGQASFYIIIPNEASKEEAEYDIDAFLYQLGYVQGLDYKFL